MLILHPEALQTDTIPTSESGVASGPSLMHIRFRQRRCSGKDCVVLDLSPGVIGSASVTFQVCDPQGTPSDCAGSICTLTTTFAPITIGLSCLQPSNQFRNLRQRSKRAVGTTTTNLLSVSEHTCCTHGCLLCRSPCA